MKFMMEFVYNKVSSLKFCTINNSYFARSFCLALKALHLMVDVRDGVHACGWARLTARLPGSGTGVRLSLVAAYRA